MNILITGANGGLGTAVCQAFLETGAKVIGVARSWTEPVSFTTLSVDLTTAEGCDAMVAQALEHGPIDALVHLLGGFGGGQTVAETSDKTWDGMMTLNLRAAFCAMRAVLKPMTAAKYGRIVAVGSRAAVEPAPNFAAYSVSKAGLVVPGLVAACFTAATSEVSTRNIARYFDAGMDAVDGRARIMRWALTKPGRAASSGAWCWS